MDKKEEDQRMKELKDRYIRFDWAIKRLLRQKANFGVLEGFLTVFLGEKITIVELLESEAMEKDTEVLNKFYENVRMNVGDIDNLEGKQMLIKNLYEKFFKGAFPKTVDKLGIVYTPVECVDFIIHSVDDILRKEFDCSLSDENVHILDPFTGTGTFITRLLQSGLIRPEDLERKYKNEIH